MVRRSAVEWEELVDAWLESGLSRGAFAEQAGVNPNTLAWWRWRLGRPTSVTRASEVGFAEVVVHGRPAPDFVVEVGDLRVRVTPGFDAGELRRLVTALC